MQSFSEKNMRAKKHERRKIAEENKNRRHCTSSSDEGSVTEISSPRANKKVKRNVAERSEMSPDSAMTPCRHTHDHRREGPKGQLKKHANIYKSPAMAAKHKVKKKADSRGDYHLASPSTERSAIARKLKLEKLKEDYFDAQLGKKSSSPGREQCSTSSQVVKTRVNKLKLSKHPCLHYIPTPIFAK